MSSLLFIMSLLIFFCLALENLLRSYPSDLVLQFLSHSFQTFSSKLCPSLFLQLLLPNRHRSRRMGSNFTISRKSRLRIYCSNHWNQHWLLHEFHCLFGFQQCGVCVSLLLLFALDLFLLLSWSLKKQTTKRIQRREPGLNWPFFLPCEPFSATSTSDQLLSILR